MTVRIREILDPELKAKVLQALSERRGLAAGAIPEWFELDDADYVDLLNDIRGDNAEEDLPDDSRM
jgi:hypothetical protein